MLTPSKSLPILRVGILRTSSLGDVVLATSCLSMLQALPFPVDITWIGRSSTLDMIQRSWPQVTTLELPKNGTLTHLTDLLEKLKKIHFIVDLQCNLRSRWLCRHLKILKGIPYFEAEKAQIVRNKLIVEARVRGRRRPLNPQTVKPSFYQYRQMSNALLKGLMHHLPIEYHDYVKNRDFPPQLPIPDDFDPPWRKELRFGQWLAIAPGAAYPTKQSPLSVTLRILKKLSSSIDQTENDRIHEPLIQNPSLFSSVGLVFLGDSKDREVARRILDNFAWNGPILNLCGKLSLWESAVALHDASVLLSNDSSLAHIAEAVDTPVAMLFGPTIESFGFAPRNPSSQAFSSPLGCRPCSKHGMVSCRYHDQLCFQTIDFQKIADFLTQKLIPPPLRYENTLEHRPIEAMPSNFREH